MRLGEAIELVSVDLVKNLLVLGKTYEEISIELQSLYPEIKRGLAERSVRRYVRQHDLKRESEEAKVRAIEESVQQVYSAPWLSGRKSILCYIAKCVNISFSSGAIQKQDAGGRTLPLRHYRHFTILSPRPIDPCYYQQKLNATRAVLNWSAILGCGRGMRN